MSRSKWRTCKFTGCLETTAFAYGTHCSLHAIPRGGVKGVTLSSIDWSVPQFCLKCKRQMRSHTDKVRLDLVVHRGKGNCVNCSKHIGRPPREKTFIDEVGITCNHCRVHKPFEDFSLRKNSRSGYCSICKRCAVILKHGITLVQYNEMLLNQNGVCLICKIPSSDILCIDHDHKCCSQKNGSCGQCVRGLLCRNCNSGIGLLKDSPDILMSAYTYLLTHTIEKDTS